MSTLPPHEERLEELEAVLFDFDGTLVDTAELIFTSFRHTAATVLGRELSRDVLLKNVGMPLKQQMEVIAPGRGDEMVAVYREHNHSHHDELARAFPHAEEVLADLAGRGMPMAVVTSKGQVAVALGVGLVGVDRYVGTVVTADDVPIHKPDPYPLQHAADVLGVDVTRCIYVGDSPHDMTSALDAGAIAVAALWGAFTEDEVLEPGPQYALSDILELLELLDGDPERFATGLPAEPREARRADGYITDDVGSEEERS